MAIDWQLNPLTWDIDIDDTTDWNLSLVTGIDYYVQKCRIKLQTFLGEWYLDTTVGVGYYETILVKNPNLTNVDNLLKLTVLEIEGINSLIEWRSSFDIRRRMLRVVFRADTDAGELLFDEGITV